MVTSYFNTNQTDWAVLKQGEKKKRSLQATLLLSCSKATPHGIQQIIHDHRRGSGCTFDGVGIDFGGGSRI